MVQGKQEAPDWLFGTIPHQFIFSSWKEIQEYLLIVNSGGDIDRMDRWCFFNI